MKTALVAIALAFAVVSFSTTVSDAKDITRCYHAKRPAGRNTSANTGTHGPQQQAYYMRSGYYTRCRTGNYNQVMNWASRCSKFFSKYFRSSMSQGNGC